MNGAPSATETRFRSLFLVCTGTVLTSLGITVPYVWLLTPLGLAFLFYTLWYLTPDARTASLFGFFFGTATGASAIGWFWDTLPLDWLHLGSPLVQIGAVAIAWGVVSISFGIATALATFSIWKLRENTFIALISALLWTVAEYLRMWSFAIATAGPGSLFGAHFSGMALGYALSENPILLQFARFGGIHALNFLVAFIAATIALLMSLRHASHHKKSFVVVIACALLIILPFLIPLEKRVDSGHTLEAAIVGINIPTEDTTNRSGEERQTLVSLGQEAVPPDLIVLPERYTLAEVLAATTTGSTSLASLFPKTDTLVIAAGHISAPDGGLYSQLAYTSSKTGTLGTYDKLFLMPLGEYPPYFARIAYAFFNDPRLKGYISRLGAALHPGEGVSGITWQGIGVGGLICSDDLSPILYQQLEKQVGASILVNTANPAWFHNSRTLLYKTIELGKVHAVENNAYYLEAANGAPSFVISPQGDVIAKTPWGGTHVLLVPLTLP